MNRKLRNFALAPIVVLAVSMPVACADEAANKPIDFNRQIRPLLAAKCFACHGPDEETREAGLRLDVRKEAVDFGAIVPGAASESELISRISSGDPNLVMPPPHASEALSDEQRKLISSWIDQGATFAKHWSFVKPARPQLPKVRRPEWPRNPIDYFVLAKLDAKGLKPSSRADRYTLVRRLYLDLIGLPPTPLQADAFVNDDDPQAYEKLVEQLLASPRYGEHWARYWLDLARYSDTNGYEKDRPRSIWPYRDWVIRALNDDMPFDQFSIEQLAGDMLPNATKEQLIATGFHRNTMLNEEGGIDPLEFRFYAMVDRVATTGTVWMGLSVGCAQCHTHKYDPITHTDFYSTMALLDNADEPDFKVVDQSILDRRAEIEDQLSRLKTKLAEQFPAGEGDESVEQLREENLEERFAGWLAEQRNSATSWQAIRPQTWSTNLPRLELLDDGSMLASGDTTKRDVYKLTYAITQDMLPATALRIEAIADDRLPGNGPGNAYYEGRKGNFHLSEVDATADGKPVEFTTSSASLDKGKGGSRSVFDGNGSSGWNSPEGESHHLVLNLAKPITEPCELTVEMLFERHYVASLGRFRIAIAGVDPGVTPKASNLPVEIEQLVAADQLTEEANSQLLDYFLSVAPELAEARKPIEALQNQMPKFPITMVMRERPADNPRPTHRHHRGEYLSPRENVTPAVPAFLSSNDAQRPANRLQFARWLVSDENPLVARVTVNRAWQALFGTGLHRTSDDFGTQSEPPTHPELLDWMACEFVEQGWSLKELHRLIVTSATYQQSSIVTPDLLAHDPQNELLARGPRFRVRAEVVRDIMLSSSGKISSKMYGPGVRPPQPQSVTTAVYGRPGWKAATGEDRYRRSIYTFSKRTAPFAAYTVFDAPSGENCTVKRDRSNNALQALTLLNDAMYVELSQALAQLCVADHDDEKIATCLFRRVLTRPPTGDELAAMLKFYQSQYERLEKGELSAKEISARGSATNQLAAWSIVARSLMNLDEAITKP